MRDYKILDYTHMSDNISRFIASYKTLGAVTCTKLVPQLLTLTDDSNLVCLPIMEDSKSVHCLLVNRAPILRNEEGDMKISIEAYGFTPVVRFMANEIASMNPIFGEAAIAYYEYILELDPAQYGACDMVGADGNTIKGLPFLNMDSTLEEWFEFLKKEIQLLKSYLYDNGPMLLQESIMREPPGMENIKSILQNALSENGIHGEAVVINRKDIDMDDEGMASFLDQQDVNDEEGGGNKPH